MRIISGSYRGRALKSTTGPGFRPAMGKVREALFSMLEARGLTWPMARVLDLFAGGGSLGFEALSRGAAHVCFVESAPYAAKVIEANAALLGVEEGRYSLRCEEAARVLALRPALPFDAVFIDPPYSQPLLEPTLKALLRNAWVRPGGLVNAEVEARQRFDAQNVLPGLELEADRAYGQTRVLIWRFE